MFAHLCTNLILICCTPCKNEVTLLMKENKIPPLMAAATSDTQTILVSFFILGMLDSRTLKSGSTGPSFLLGDLVPRSHSNASTD